jgi:hypothetical protein
MIMAMVVVLPAAEQAGDAAARDGERDIVDRAGGLVDLDQMRDLNRCGSLGISGGQGSQLRVVVRHAGRSLGHHGGKRKARVKARAGICDPLAGPFVVATRRG